MVEGEHLRSLPYRPFRIGLFGKTLEEALQTLIEKHPEVLPGKQMDPGSDDHPRFVLLRREVPAGGLSLDHLLVDQRGVLTLVEAKLFQNPEARREVIGQIMEYAAAARESWGKGRAREGAAEFWSRQGRHVDEIIRETFGEDIDLEAFWTTVEENLQQGMIRLIIAADELRPEVRRIIEYLNSQMSTVEIYGLELRCYGDESKSLVLVPRLVGQAQAKDSSEVTLWTSERLRAAYNALPIRAMSERLRQVLDWAEGQGFFMAARAKTPVFGLRGRSGARIVSFSPDWTFCYLNERVYPVGREERDRFVDKLKGIGMYDSEFDPQDIVSGRNFARKLTDLGEDDLERLLEVFTHFCGKQGGP